jgi:hypothetical protein
MRPGAFALCCASAAVLACASQNPAAPSPPLTVVKQAVHGDFFERPWVHGRVYTSRSAGTVSVEMSFLGDYSDWLWIEVWQTGALLGQAIAKGYFAPKQRLDVPVSAGVPYEVRLWTDKCCTRYQGFVIRPE